MVGPSRGRRSAPDQDAADTSSKDRINSARHRCRSAECPVSVLPMRTNTRSRAGQTSMYCPSWPAAQSIPNGSAAVRQCRLVERLPTLADQHADHGVQQRLGHRPRKQRGLPDNGCAGPVPPGQLAAVALEHEPTTMDDHPGIGLVQRSVRVEGPSDQRVQVDATGEADLQPSLGRARHAGRLCPKRMERDAEGVGGRRRIGSVRQRARRPRRRTGPTPA